MARARPKMATAGCKTARAKQKVPVRTQNRPCRDDLARAEAKAGVCVIFKVDDEGERPLNIQYMRTPSKKYKYWIQFRPQISGKKNEQDLSWEKLIDIVSSKDVRQIEAIKFCHRDAPFGTEHVDGMTVLELWKEVKKRQK